MSTELTTRVHRQIEDEGEVPSEEEDLLLEDPKVKIRRNGISWTLLSTMKRSYA
jgi:hypothetical protein